MTDAAGKNLVAQHRIDDRAFAIRCATEKCNFHVIARQHFADIVDLEDKATKCLCLSFVDNVAMALTLGKS